MSLSSGGACSIIIVHYLNTSDTLACLKSALALEFPHKSLIVLDNGSGNGSYQQLLSALNSFLTPLNNNATDGIATYKAADNSLVYLSQQATNKGFAYGVNRGIELANRVGNPELYLLLNNDVILPSNTLAAMQKKLSAKRRIDLVGVRSRVNHNGKSVTFSAGCVNAVLGQTKQIDIHSTDLVAAQENHQQRVYYPLGSCLLVTKQLYDTVGPLDECFFLYYEEADYVMRMRQQGFCFSVCDTITIEHKEGGTSGSSSDKSSNSSALSDYYLLRSRIVFLRRYFSRYRLLWLTVHLANCARRLMRGEVKKCFQALSLLRGRNVR
jgi:GT2 family glycosyltransferase